MDVVVENRGEGKGNERVIFDDDELYTPIEIATRLKITKEAVYNWVRLKKLKPIRLGKRAIRIQGCEINKLIWG